MEKNVGIYHKSTCKEALVNKGHRGPVERYCLLLSPVTHPSTLILLLTTYTRSNLQSLINPSTNLSVVWSMGNSGGNPHIHRKNMQAPHKQQLKSGMNPDNRKCVANALTSGSLLTNNPVKGH